MAVAVLSCFLLYFFWFTLLHILIRWFTVSSFFHRSSSCCFSRFCQYFFFGIMHYFGIWWGEILFLFLSSSVLHVVIPEFSIWFLNCAAFSFHNFPSLLFSSCLPHFLFISYFALYIFCKICNNVELLKKEKFFLLFP